MEGLSLRAAPSPAWIPPWVVEKYIILGGSCHGINILAISSPLLRLRERKQGVYLGQSMPPSEVSSLVRIRRQA